MSAGRASGPFHGVRLAVVRGLVQEHQVPGTRSLMGSLGGPACPQEQGTVVLLGSLVRGWPVLEVGEDSFGGVVFPHEVVAGLAERGQSVPAGLHGAGTGDPVALAFSLDGVKNGLKQ